MSNISDADLIDQFMEYLTFRNRTPRTKSTYRSTLGRLSTWLNVHGETLLTATALDLEKWQRGLTVAPNSVASYGVAVRSFYSWTRRKNIRDDPAMDLELPALKRGIPRPISEEDLALAIETAPHRVRPWLVLAAYAGLRACEIAPLRRDHLLDTAEPPVIIVEGKGGKERAVPLSPYVWGELLGYGLPRRGYNFERADRRSGPNQAWTISALANEHLDSLGLDNTLHHLRHRFGTQALKAAGGNLRVVQDLLGHSSPSTTQVYTAFANEAAVAAVLGVQPKRPIPQSY